MVRLQREAARDFEMALAANTHHAVAHFNLGSVLYCLGDHGNRLQVRLHFRSSYSRFRETRQHTGCV